MDFVQMKPKNIFSFLFLLCLVSYGAFKNPVADASELKISADTIKSDQDSNMVTGEGNVRLEYGDVVLTARKAELNRDNMDFIAEGNVVVKLAAGGGEWKAPAIKGNLKTKKISFGPYRLTSTVWHGGGKSGASDGEGNVRSKEIWLTSCDREKPHYSLTASSVKYSDDNTFRANNLVLRFGGVPVFYFPVLWGTTDGSSGYIIKPGYSGKKGAYLRFGRVKKYGEEGEASAYVDLMSKRGVGIGADVDYIDEKHTFKSRIYGILDSDPPETEHGYDRRFRSRDERYRLSAYYSEELAPGIDIRLNIDLLSDIEMLSDWFRRDYRRLEQPRSYLDLNYDSEYFSTGIGIRPRLNDFYTVVETLPEYRFDVPRINIAGTSFQYESRTRLGYYSMKWRDFDRSRPEMFDYLDNEAKLFEDPNDYESFRAHSQHFIYLPLHLGDFSTFTPRAGIAGTYYSRSSKGKITDTDIADMLDVDDPDHPYSRTDLKHYDAEGGDVMRTAFEFGAEWKSRIYSDWFDWNSETFRISGVRHVLEPYINYTYAPDPSHDRDTLYYFDETDRLDRQHFVRFGIDQRLITRRDGGNGTFLRLQSYYDFHFDRGEESERHPGDLGNRLDFTPRKDLAFWTGVVYDAGERKIHRGEAGLRFGEEDKLNFSTRYVFRNGHLSRSVWSMGSSLADISGESSYLKKRFEETDIIACELFIPINPLTSLTVEAEYDFDKSRLSEHRYILRRRLHCWDVGVGVGWDNSDFELMLLAQLVAFPKVKLNVDF